MCTSCTIQHCIIQCNPILYTTMDHKTKIQLDDTIDLQVRRQLNLTHLASDTCNKLGSCPVQRFPCSQKTIPFRRCGTTSPPFLGYGLLVSTILQPAPSKCVDIIVKLSSENYPTHRGWGGVEFVRPNACICGGRQQKRKTNTAELR